MYLLKKLDVFKLTTLKLVRIQEKSRILFKKMKNILTKIRVRKKLEGSKK